MPGIRAPRCSGLVGRRLSGPFRRCAVNIRLLERLKSQWLCWGPDSDGVLLGGLVWGYEGVLPGHNCSWSTCPITGIIGHVACSQWPFVAVSTCVLRPIDRRPRTGRPGPGPDSLAGALLPQGLPALGRSREPLRKHMQSVLPFLERQERADSYLARLNSLANALENTGEPPQDSASFDTWCTRYLSHDRSPKPELPLKSTPRARRCTPRATLKNARPSSPSAQHFQRTRTCSSSAGTTTKAGCSPGT